GAPQDGGAGVADLPRGAVGQADDQLGDDRGGVLDEAGEGDGGLVSDDGLGVAIAWGAADPERPGLDDLGGHVDVVLVDEYDPQRERGLGAGLGAVVGQRLDDQGHEGPRLLAEDWDGHDGDGTAAGVGAEELPSPLIERLAADGVVAGLLGDVGLAVLAVL